MGVAEKPKSSAVRRRGKLSQLVPGPARQADTGKRDTGALVGELPVTGLRSPGTSADERVVQ